jgi:hypothetical protein
MGATVPSLAARQQMIALVVVERRGVSRADTIDKIRVSRQSSSQLGRPTIRLDDGKTVDLERGAVSQALLLNVR